MNRETKFTKIWRKHFFLKDRNNASMFSFHTKCDENVAEVWIKDNKFDYLLQSFTDPKDFDKFLELLLK